MAPQQVIAPSPAPYGVRHSNVRHTTRFTVIGNHLIQHPRMTLTARGLGAYIQSLPPGTAIGIKDLARRVPEGTTRIATALRELEAHGYLKRTVEQLPDGRFVTRTVSYNHPAAMTRPAPVPPPAPEAASEPEPEPEPVPDPKQEPEPAPEPVREPGPEATPDPEPPSPRRLMAMDLLGRLRRVDHRLLLGRRDIERLAEAVEVWVERGGSADAITTALAADLPDVLTNPAGLIAHRLKAQVPPSLEAEFRRPARVPPAPFQNCTDCERAFRSPEPGRCRDCATSRHRSHSLRVREGPGRAVRPPRTEEVALPGALPAGPSDSTDGAG
ncbi:helix-turn-helix domain-containing protein [Streptomyces sp. NPDC001568]|uniref:helix-turn-helix domain-containing protein n=1 Tax=Streptomyces sp. NPDC001568 TaxID=3364588 RepID=UPI0036A56E36